MTTAKQPNVPAWLVAILVALGVIGVQPGTSAGITGAVG